MVSAGYHEQIGFSWRLLHRERLHKQSGLWTEEPGRNLGPHGSIQGARFSGGHHGRESDHFSAIRERDENEGLDSSLFQGINIFCCLNDDCIGTVTGFQVSEIQKESTG